MVKGRKIKQNEIFMDMGNSMEIMVGRGYKGTNWYWKYIIKIFSGKKINFNLRLHLYQAHNMNIFGQNIFVQGGSFKVGNHLHRNNTSILR